MTTHLRFILSSMALLLLVGCSRGAFGGFETVVEPIEDTVVVRTIQYLDGEDVGDLYSISVTVPEEWVGQFETRTEGNKITFDFVETDGQGRASLFFIEALSRPQYWKQVGSYPDMYTNLNNQYRTYFVYHVPNRAYYSGLPADQFEELASVVPGVMETFSFQLVESF